MVHLVAIDRLLTGDKGGRVAQLPDGGEVTRKRGWLVLNGSGIPEKELKKTVSLSRIDVANTAAARAGGFRFFG